MRKTTNAKSNAAKMAAALDMEYLPAGKAPIKIPAGKALVHNSVTGGMTPNKRIGADGFRAWYGTAPAGKDLEPCSCGWQPGLRTHDRVRLAVDAAGTRTRHKPPSLHLEIAGQLAG